MEKVLPWQLEEVRSQLVGWGRSRCLPACLPAAGTLLDYAYS